MRIAHLCTAVCAVKICLCWYLSHHTNHHIPWERSGIRMILTDRINNDPFNNERPRRSSACGRGAGRSPAASADAPCAFCFTALGYNYRPPCRALFAVAATVAACRLRSGSHAAPTLAHRTSRSHWERSAAKSWRTASGTRMWTSMVSWSTAKCTAVQPPHPSQC